MKSLINKDDGVCLIALNSSYTHTSLAARCLEKSCAKPIRVLERSINEKTDYICADILSGDARVFAFCCYIWNIEKAVSIAKRIRAAKSDAVIIFGGPEVSYEPKKTLEEYGFVDYVICGEGEISFSALVCGENPDKIGGLAYRSGDEIISASPVYIENLDALPRLYTKEETEALSNKIIYYETSRGCPFKCSYCISSTSHAVRFVSLEKVFSDFKMFMDMSVPLVKLVDRTFNINEERTVKILNFILQNNKTTCFHFEIAADILTDRIIDVLVSAPKGMFQLEIGVQSTNEKTLAAIDRKADFSKIAKNVTKLAENKNINLHLDLIAALPYEDYNSFKKSFDDVFSLRPDMLQLGFLKMLSGCKIRREADVHGYVYSEKPPYEVIKNNYMSYSEILKLKILENALDIFYNSAAFVFSAEHILKSFDSPFELFLSVGEFIYRKGLLFTPVSRKSQYGILNDFCTENHIEGAAGEIKKDFIIHEKNGALPAWLNMGEDKAFYEYADEKAKKIYPNESLREIKMHTRAAVMDFGKEKVLYDYRTENWIKI